MANQLRKQLASQYSEGDKLPCEAQLARQFGCSVHTLREALSVLSQEGWVRRKHGSGTFVARPVSSQKSQSPRQVGIRIELDPADVRLSPFYLHILYSLQQELTEHGWQPRLYSGRINVDTMDQRPEPCPPLLDDAAAGHLAGVIAVGTLPHESWIAPLHQAGVPLVGTHPDYQYSVCRDDRALIEAGVQALAEGGAKQLAMIGWHDPASPQILAMKDIFDSTVRHRGLSTRAEWLRQDVHPNTVGAGWEQFRDLWSYSHVKPDGLLICDDMFYTEVAIAIAELGIHVPDQLQVVSLANRDSGMFCPFPTTLLESDPAIHARDLVAQLQLLMEGQPIAVPRRHLPYQRRRVERATSDRHSASLAGDAVVPPR